MYKNPTDLELLECIYNHYRAEFALYDSDETIRAGKVYVPIDCRLIAAIFAVVVAVGAAAITAYDVFGSKT
ncbi:hypothetical protein CGK13_22950 [Vibrio parahaemolyticus]|nr:hypothetical protein CGK13_22950 [Vibrio parahaemolyticus]HAV1510830.1 hypothetical protein [Vibrio parahaemolyticus]